MAITFFLILSVSSALLYRLVFRNRLTYLSVHDSLISERKKTGIFRAQVMGSVILAVFLVKAAQSYFPSSEEDADLHFVILLAVFYVIVLLISGFLIDLILRLTSPQMNLYSVLVENPDLIAEEEELKTTSLMKPEDFWQLLNKEDKPINPEQYKVRLAEVSNELSKYHPIKQVEFYNRLLELRKDLFSGELYEIYHYAWGRKYQENHSDQFLEFIIAQGRTEVEKIKLDLSRIALLDMNLIKLNRFSITSVFMNLYLSATQRFFPVKEEIEMIKAISSLQAGSHLLKEKYPSIYQKFK